MSLLKYLADTNVISDWMRGVAPVTQWLIEYESEVAISTLTLAQLRRGIELKAAGKARKELERKLQWMLEDYQERIWVFDGRSAEREVNGSRLKRRGDQLRAF